MLITGVVVALLVHGAQDAGPGATHLTDRETLGILGGFRVHLVGVDAYAEDAGLTRASLAALATAELRANGIPIMEGSTVSADAAPVGDLTLAVFLADSNPPIGSVLVTVRQRAQLRATWPIEPITWASIWDLFPRGAPPGDADGGPSVVVREGTLGDQYLAEIRKHPLRQFALDYRKSREEWLDAMRPWQAAAQNTRKLSAAGDCSNALAALGTAPATPEVIVAMRDVAACYEAQNLFGPAMSIYATVAARSWDEKVIADATTHLRDLYQRETAPKAASCSQTAELTVGMTRKAVRKLLGEVQESSMQTCGGAPGVKRWQCETLEFACSKDDSQGLNWSIHAVLNEAGRLVSWSVDPHP
jgi:hypothetical protein